MRQYFHLPYDAALTGKQLAQVMTVAFPDKKIEARADEVIINYRPLVRGRLRIRRNDKEQMVTISYGSSMPFGMAWWPWLFGVLPALMLWAAYLFMKGSFVRQMTEALRTGLGNQFTEHPSPFPFLPSDEERRGWHRGAAMWLRWIGIFCFVNKFVLSPFLNMIYGYYFSIEMLHKFTMFQTYANHILNFVIGLAIGMCLILIGRGSKSGRWAGWLRIVQALWGVVVALFTAYYVRATVLGMTSEQFSEYARSGHITWHSVVFFIIGSAFALSIGILLWRSLRTGPGRYLLMAAIWTVGLNVVSQLLESFIIPNIDSSGRYVFIVMFSSISYILNLVPAILMLKAWYHMPDYMPQLYSRDRSML